MGRIHSVWHRCRQWSLSPSQRQRATELAEQVERAFCEHPRQTGETYWQHLWFTTTMAARFMFTMAVLLIHGLFPFLLTRTASTQIEAVYRIMKKRIPKNRRDVIDLDYQV